MFLRHGNGPFGRVCGSADFKPDVLDLFAKTFDNKQLIVGDKDMVLQIVHDGIGAVIRISVCVHRIPPFYLFSGQGRQTVNIPEQCREAKWFLEKQRRIEQRTSLL
jgi:hypothetical protein